MRILACLLLALPVLAEGDLDTRLRALRTAPAKAAADAVHAVLAASPERADVIARLRAGVDVSTMAAGWHVLAATDTEGVARPFFLFVPKTLKGRAPLLVHMHGGVSRPAFADTLPVRGVGGMWEASAERAGFVVALPCARGDCMWWSEAGVRHVRAVIREVKRRVPIDDDAIFGTGFSDGGSGCFHLAMAAPDPFAAFLPMNGHPAVAASASGKQLYLRNLRHTPLYVTMTRDDQLYPAASVLEHLGLSLKEGAPIRLVSWEGGGHRPVYFEALRTNFEAFLANTRRPGAVRALDWECAEPCRVGWVEVLALGAGAADAAALPDLNVMSTPGRVRLGVNVDRAFAGPGVKVTVVVKGSTAALIGMRPGDVVVGLDGAAIKDLGALGAALGAKTFDTGIAVRVRRGEEELDLKGRLPEFVSRPYYARAAPTARVSVRVGDERIDVVTRHVRKLRLSLTRAAAALPVRWNGRDVAAKPTALALGDILRRYAARADGGRVFEAELVLDEAAFAPAAKPRLVVVISVDQMRPDTWIRFRDKYTGGIKRLLDGGARFDGILDHAATQTGPGHATMLTGCNPGKAGIVANAWLDPKTLKQVYCVGDAEHKRSPRNLLRTTLGDWMKKADARTKVYSVSSKDRSAILMGGKGPNGVFWLDKVNGFGTSGAYGGWPAWLTAFNDDGWIEKLPEHWTYEIDPALRADDDPRESPRYSRAAPHPLRAGTRKKTLDNMYRTPYTDTFTLKLATDLVARFDLGGDDAPDLLCIGLSATDTIGHLYGPRSQEMRDNTLRLDRELGAFFAMLDKRGAPWVLALTADHGVLPLDELERVNVPRFFARVEADLKKRVGHSGLMRQASGVIYFDRARLAALGLDFKTVVHEAAAAFAARKSVHAVFVTSELDTAKGDLARLVRNSFHPERSGDLILIPKHGVLADLYGTGTSHGSPWDYDREVPLVFYGGGVPAGARGPGRTIDIAPSLARLLGVTPPAGIDGRDLELR